MKRLIFVFAVVILAILLSQTNATATTPTGATYDIWVRSMLAQQQAQYPQMYALDPQYVTDTYRGNEWWLKPLLDKINGKFPWYATPLTQDELTKFAIAKAQILAISAKDDCEKGLIRDSKSFPTDFKKCDKPNDPYWWVVNYANNVEMTRAAFDVSPQVFKVNTWADNRFFSNKFEYCYGLPAWKCF